MKSEQALDQTENIGGNHYDKYNSKNPIARALVDGFLKTFDQFTQADKPLKIYEIGCGEGILSQRIAEKGHTVHGCDIDTDVIARAKIFESKTLTFSVGSIYDIQDGALADYDLVYCCEVFEHLPDPDLALTKLYESGAQEILLSVPREPLWRILNMARFKYWSDLGNTPGHLNHWSSHSFLQFVQKYYNIEDVARPLPWTFVKARAPDA